jgi:hypothetical protein
MRKYLTSIILIVFISPICIGHSIRHREILLPKVKAKLDSLYPHYSWAILDQSSIHDTTQNDLKKEAEKIMNKK